MCSFLTTFLFFFSKNLSFFPAGSSLVAAVPWGRQVLRAGAAWAAQSSCCLLLPEQGKIKGKKERGSTR